MGTTIAISADAGAAESVMPAIETAFAAVERIENLMHPTRIGSDLLAIHLAKPGVPVTVHAWTWEVLALAWRLNQISEGAFDPCLPDAEGRLADLELAPPHSVIRRKPVHIDLGGIAKGFAVDRALEALRAAGCRNGLVNAGGDLAVFGDQGYPVVIVGEGVTGGLVELKNSALATSDVCTAARPAEHRGYYHGASRRTIKTGRVTVCAPSAAIADALTKCLLADLGARSAQWLDAFNARCVGHEVPP